MPSQLEIQQRLVDEMNEREQQVKLEPGETSLHFFRKVYHDPAQPMPRRMQAAKEAAPFEHAKKGTGGPDNNNAELLDREVNRRRLYTESWYDKNPEMRPRSMPKLIEAKAVEVKGEGERDPRDR